MATLKQPCTGYTDSGNWANTFEVTTPTGASDSNVLEVPLAAITLVVSNNAPPWATGDTPDDTRDVTVDGFTLAPGRTQEFPCYGFGHPKYPTTITIVCGSAATASSFFTLRTYNGE